jgi:hypothetical protein
VNFFVRKKMAILNQNAANIKHIYSKIIMTLFLKEICQNIFFAGALSKLPK